MNHNLIAICAQTLAGGLTATALLLTVAVVVRRARQKPGDHRPDQIASRYVAAAMPEGDLPFVPGPDYQDIDDWTSDLPTAVIPAARGPQYILSAHDLRAPGHECVAKFRADLRRHTSPSQVAADEWPPIFAHLADQWGYDHERGFDALLAAT
nr:hypothetical protein [Mycobacterium sp. UM_NZ2]